MNTAPLQQPARGASQAARAGGARGTGDALQRCALASAPAQCATPAGHGPGHGETSDAGLRVKEAIPSAAQNAFMPKYYVILFSSIYLALRIKLLQ